MTTAAALLLTACVGGTQRKANDGVYAIAPALDVTTLLSPPPEGEAAKERDLAAVRAAQQTRTAQQSAEAEENSAVDVFLFRSVLGPSFEPQQLPKTRDFFRRVLRTALPFVEITKNCWSRPRPFVVDPAIVPLKRSLASTRAPARAPSRPVRIVPRAADSPCVAPNDDPSFSPSYPSGHAMFGTMTAILLAQMVPEHRGALFARGWAFGEARVIGGVHFPSDVEAGRILGTILVDTMQHDLRFQADLRDSRSELRAVLGYP